MQTETNRERSDHNYSVNTSVPSERIFSTADLTVNFTQSLLAPSSVDKVVFVGEIHTL